MLSTSGPPLLPGLIAASVCSRFDRLSSVPVRVRPFADKMPSVTVGAPP